MNTDSKTILISGWAHDTTIFPGLPGLDDPVSLTDLEDQAAQMCPDTLGSVFARGLAHLLSGTPATVNLVGWSTGALTALETALRLPEKIRRLILISPTPKFCSDGEWDAGIPSANVRAMMTGMRRNPETTIRGFLRLAAAPLNIPEEQLCERIQRILKKDLKRLARQLQYLIDTDVRAEIKQLTVPTLILHGQKDALIPFAAGQWLAENLTDARLVSYPGQGHSIPMTVPSRLTREIDAFI